MQREPATLERFARAKALVERLRLEAKQAREAAQR
jgi:hypothetical protein